MKKSIYALILSGIIATSMTGCDLIELPLFSDAASSVTDLWICDECGEMVNGGHFCSQCGTERKEDTSNGDVWICQNCNESVSGNFCPKCGSAKGTANNFTQTSEPKENNPEPSTSAFAPSGNGSLSSPASLNEWVAMNAYNAYIGEYQNLYVRVTGVAEGKDAQKLIDEYNANSSYNVATNADSLFEVNVVLYDVMYSDDWTMADYGASSPSVRFSVCAPDGGTVQNENGYLISSYCDITVKDYSTKYHNGDIISGMGAFTMLKNYDNYLFEIGSDSKTYIKTK